MIIHSEGEPTAEDLTVRVRVRTGQLVGSRAGGGFRFLGVPFAVAPVGPRAFEPPVALPDSDEVTLCLSYGATAPQIPPTSLVPLPSIEGDNCLNLNIWTPTLAAENLPVLVWIHGGGYNWGSNASPWYDGTNFARDGVVFVAVNYRTGAEGCLYLGADNVNRSLLDNVMALTWIQENIAAFGGDPARVTIGGQSAGGRSCLALYSSAAAEGLFSRTFSMSAGGALPKTLAQAEGLSRDYAAAAGVPCSAEGLASIPPARRSAIDLGFVSLGRQRPAWEEIVEHYHGDSHRWGPVLDGRFYDDTSYVSAATRRANGDALLIGTTSQENVTANTSLAASMSLDDLRAALRMFSLQDGPADHYLAQAAHPHSPAHAFAAAIVDWHYRVPSMRVAGVAGAIGRPAFRYEFRWHGEEDGATAKHGIDILFLFDNLAADAVEHRIGSDPPQETATRMHEAFVRFIRGGQPWQAYTPASPATMIFDGRCRLEIGADATLDAVWRGLDGAA